MSELETSEPEVRVSRYESGGERHLLDPCHTSIQNGGPIMSTAVGRNGSSLGGRAPQPDDLVTVKGIEMTVDAAANRGFIRKNTEGLYEDTLLEETFSADTADTNQEAQGGDLEVSSETADALGNWLPFIDNELGKGAGTQAMSEFLLDRTRLPSGVDELADAHGIGKSEFVAQAQAVVHDVEQSINQHLQQSAGLTDFDGFWHWAHQQYGSDKVYSVGIEVVRLGQMSTFESWAAKYVTSTATLPGLEGGRRETGQCSSHTVLVMVEGRKIEVEKSAWDTLKRNNPSRYRDAQVIRR